MHAAQLLDSEGLMPGFFKAKQLFTLVGLSLLAYFWLYPLIPLVVGGLNSLSRGLLGPPSVRTWTLNSLITTTTHTVIQLSLCILAAYAVARLDFYGKRLIFMFILFGLLIPEVVTFMPLYLLVKKLELHNTYAALMLPGLASPLAVFLLVIFFRAIPSELQQAAFFRWGWSLGVYDPHFVAFIFSCACVGGTFRFYCSLEQFFMAFPGRART